MSSSADVTESNLWFDECDEVDVDEDDREETVEERDFNELERDRFGWVVCVRFLDDVDEFEDVDTDDELDKQKFHSVREFSSDGERRNSKKHKLQKQLDHISKISAGQTEG